MNFEQESYKSFRLKKASIFLSRAGSRRTSEDISETCGQPIFTAFALVADVSSMSLDKNQPPLFGKKEQLSVRAIALGYWLFKIND